MRLGNLDGQPQQWRDGPVNRQYLGQDSRGNPKGYQDLAVAANSESWSFDLLDRLSTAQGGYGTQSFTLDAVGHRRSSGQDGQLTSYQYPSLSPQLQSLQGAVTLNLGYDANGNLITYGQKALEYDASNRFVRLSEQGQWRASYVHNGLGERAIKRQPGLTTDYLYGPDGELLMEATLQGSQNRYQYLNGQPLGLHQSQPGLFNQRQSLSGNLAGWQGLAQLDWNGDQQVDVLVRAGTELAVFEGQANGSVSLKRLLSGLGSDWQLAGVGDVNGDGRDDSLWRHRTSGDNAVLLAQAAGVEVVDWPKVADVGWQMRVIADFNGDGKADILWRHASQGDLAWWQLDGKRVVQALNLPRIADLSWQPQAQAAALQPGEGATLVWRQQGSGAMAAMRLNQTSYRVWDLPTVADAGWKVLRLADLNGDGQAELLWRHDNGSTYLWTDLAQGVRLGQRSLTLTLESDWSGFSHSGQTAHRLLQQQTGSGALRQLQGQTERQQYYYHNDPLGTPQVLTDSWGQPVWQARYSPFGAVKLSTPLLTNNLRMPGQYWDAESGWHYNYFRTYDPSLGRYLQSDPIGLAGGVNTYAYVGGDPVNYVDPDGLSPYRAILPGGGQFYVPFHAARVSHLSQQIQRYNPGFSYQSIRPQRGPGSTYNQSDVRELEAILRNEQQSNSCSRDSGNIVKRGPKTDPTAPHNAKIREIGERIELFEGGMVIAGGGRLAERQVPTPGGFKSNRRPDVLYKDANGILRAINVGRTKADGSPVSREQKAMQDLNGAGLPTTFERYD